MTVEKDAVVLVTGASGYIAVHLTELLLKEGYKVRGTVRSLKNEEKVRPLRNLCPNSRYPLELVEADLFKEDGWMDAVKDCTYVLHVASPFPNAPPSHEQDLLKPAVDGTLRVLKACAETGGAVKRVVLTSSISAVHGETDIQEGRVYTEQDWSDPKSPFMDAYAKSKTLAEKAAWDFVSTLPPEKKFQLVTINPGLVIGPILYKGIGTSVEIIKRLMDHSMPLIPRLNFCLCDVRDVALAHLRAMTLPEAVGNRHIIASQHLWMREIAHILANEFGQQGYAVPTWSAPYFTLWLYSFFDKSTRLIINRVGKEYIYSSQRMKNILGVMPRDIKQSLIDTVYSLIDTGVIKKTKVYKHNKERGEKTGGE